MRTLPLLLACGPPCIERRHDFRGVLLTRIYRRWRSGGGKPHTPSQHSQRAQQQPGALRWGVETRLANAVQNGLRVQLPVIIPHLIPERQLRWNER